MIEKIVINYLGGKLSSPVYAGEPSRKEGSYITVEKTGTQRYLYAERSTLSVVSWADSILEAAKLNEEAKEQMLLLPENEETVAECELSSDAFFSDTMLKKYGYQAFYEIDHIWKEVKDGLSQD